jgi:hypothetical protein
MFEVVSNATSQDVLEETLNKVLNHIVVEYFQSFFAVCLITSSLRRYKPSLQVKNIYNLNFDENSSKNLLLEAVDGGCQAYIISQKSFETFLNEFYSIHDRSIQVFPNKHIVVYHDDILSEDLKSSHEIWKNYNALNGK